MINVAIDGPAGAGKSTIAKAAAKELGFIYVDTGALYRTIALSAVRYDAVGDNEKIIEMLGDITVKLGFAKDGSQCVYLNSEDVSSLIRTPEISMAASKVSAIPEVRAFLLDLQRDIAKENNVIMDGRDIASVVCRMQNQRYFFLHHLSAELKEDIRSLSKRVNQSVMRMCWLMLISVIIRIHTVILHHLSLHTSLLWLTHQSLIYSSQ